MGGKPSKNTPLECMIKILKRDLMETMELTPNKLKFFEKYIGLLLS
jgi:hypothetical protein